MRKQKIAISVDQQYSTTAAKLFGTPAISTQGRHNFIRARFTSHRGDDERVVWDLSTLLTTFQKTLGTSTGKTHDINQQSVIYRIQSPCLLLVYGSLSEAWVLRHYQPTSRIFLSNDFALFQSRIFDTGRKNRRQLLARHPMFIIHFFHPRQNNSHYKQRVQLVRFSRNCFFINPWVAL